MITAALFPKVKPNHRHWYAYDVLIDGKPIVIGSRDPEHDLARALLALGIEGCARIVDGRSGKPRSKVNIRKAAKLCIGSNLETFKWKRTGISDSSPCASESHPEGRGSASRCSRPSLRCSRIST